MQQSPKTSEPSMEEILASIRKIIAEDPADVPPPAQAHQVPAPQAPASHSLAPASTNTALPRADAAAARRLPEGAA